MRSAIIYGLMLFIAFCTITGEIEQIRGKHFQVAVNLMTDAHTDAIALIAESSAATSEE